MNIIKLNSSHDIGNYVGKIISDSIKNNPNIVLGLATGSSPLSTYKFLIQDHLNNKTDWSYVTTFNLDEYIGLDKKDKQSYYYFMQEKLFQHLNINKENIYIPSGVGDYEDYAKKYDDIIKNKNGIDIQLLGLGENGHIGFNEPPCSFDSETQVVNLKQSTINANSRFFKSKSEVPKQAVSMGIKSIMSAKKIILIAFGKNKARAIKELVNGNISENIPCTILQKHQNITIVIDKEASMLLS